MSIQSIIMHRVVHRQAVDFAAKIVKTSNRMAKGETQLKFDRPDRMTCFTPDKEPTCLCCGRLARVVHLLELVNRIAESTTYMKKKNHSNPGKK